MRYILIQNTNSRKFIGLLLMFLTVPLSIGLLLNIHKNYKISQNSVDVAEVANVANVVSVSASIEPNEHNTLAMQLDEAKKALDERAKLVEEREQALINESKSRNGAITSVPLWVALLISLCVLVLGLHFYFDFELKKFKVTKKL